VNDNKKPLMDNIPSGVFICLKFHNSTQFYTIYHFLLAIIPHLAVTMRIRKKMAKIVENREERQ